MPGVLNVTSFVNPARPGKFCLPCLSRFHNWLCDNKTLFTKKMKDSGLGLTNRLYLPPPVIGKPRLSKFMAVEGER